MMRSTLVKFVACLLLTHGTYGTLRSYATGAESASHDTRPTFVRQIGWPGLGAQVPHDLGPVTSVSSMDGVHYAVTSSGVVRRWGWNGGTGTPEPPVRSDALPVEVWSSGINSGYGSVIVQFADGLFLGQSLSSQVQFPSAPFSIPGLAQLAFLSEYPVGRFDNGELRYLFVPVLQQQDAIIASDAVEFASSGQFGAYRRANGEIVAVGLFTAWNPVWNQWPPVFKYWPWTAETTKPRPANWDGITKFRPGFERIVALRSDGTLAGWGLNHYGQCDFPATLGPVSDFRCDEGYNGGGTVVLLESGEVTTWPPSFYYPGVPSDIGAFRGFSNGGSRGGMLLMTDSPRPSCPANLAGCCPEANPQFVDGEDLAALLAVWGPCEAEAPADLDLNGIVDGADLAVLLNAWGLCRN